MAHRIGFLLLNLMKFIFSVAMEWDSQNEVIDRSKMHLVSFEKIARSIHHSYYDIFHFKRNRQH